MRRLVLSDFVRMFEEARHLLDKGQPLPEDLKQRLLEYRLDGEDAVDVLVKCYLLCFERPEALAPVHSDLIGSERSPDQMMEALAQAPLCGPDKTIPGLWEILVAQINRVEMPLPLWVELIGQLDQDTTLYQAAIARLTACGASPGELDSVLEFMQDDNPLYPIIEGKLQPIP